MASIALAALGRAERIETLAMIGGYGVLFFGIGAAPFQLRLDLNLYSRSTCAVLIGFSVLLTVGALMGDVRGLWHPVAAVVILIVAAATLHARAWVRTPAPFPDLGAVILAPFSDLADSLRRITQGGETWERGPSGWTRRAGYRPDDLSTVVIWVGTALWLVAALMTRDPEPGFWGMLTQIGPIWYVGLALVLLGFAVGRRSEIRAAMATLSFGLGTTLTPALVYGSPRIGSAGKQAELTEYVLLHHHIAVTAGIYQAFSATFSGMAMLCQLLGIHGLPGSMGLLGLASYWPVMLVVVRIAVLRTLAGRLLPTTGRRWSAVILVLLVDTLGDDYYSPQSIGYVLAIGMVALAITGLNDRPLSPRWTVVLLTLSGIALAPTHELSPYMIAGALFILAVFRQAPRWAWLPVTLPALAWAAVVHKAIGQNFNFSSLFDLNNFRPPVTVSTPGLSRLPIVGYQSHALLLALLILMALGAAGFLPNIRRGWAWAYALCPSVGLALIAINPYGNEGIFRAALFAIPWMAILAMKVPEPRALKRYLRRQLVVTVAVGACLLGLLPTFVVGAYAMDGTNVLARAEVAVLTNLSRLPPRHAAVLSIGSAINPADGVPFTIDYTSLEWSPLVDYVHALNQLHPTRADLRLLNKYFRLYAESTGSKRSSPLYIIWTYQSLLYSQAYGLQAPSQLLGWLTLLRQSPRWRLVAHDGPNYLFRYQR